MNKRQRKKWFKKILERSDYFQHLYTPMLGRKNGKTYLWRKLHHAIFSTKYKAFKEMKRCFTKGNKDQLIMHQLSKGGIISTKEKNFFLLHSTEGPEIIGRW
ncbi:hypothetical protein I5677_12170 [Mobilitalea sibirica]|uniref:Uncharacterized protein n=1 Tax=Mobilitalea sibirica TaxID=1462919 RepID=A0A8J7H032_9FIRM|nr:hypothetical protein [Mobilitalea sibirica]MBH1941649.1 hypothetical protein [Mobilitalea sibirica]